MPPKKSTPRAAAAETPPSADTSPHTPNPYSCGSSPAVQPAFMSPLDTSAAVAPSPAPAASEEEPRMSSTPRSASPVVASPEHSLVQSAVSSPARSVTPSPCQAKKTSRDRLQLTAEDEEDLVDWYREQEVFFNKTLKGYRDTQRKNALIEEKARSMGKTAAELKTWINSMRTQYGKLQKKGPSRTGKKTVRENWILNRFCFLNDHIRRMAGREESTVQQPEDSSSSHEEEEEHVQEGSRPPCALPRPLSASSQGTKRKRSQDEPAGLTNILEEMRSFQSAVLERQQHTLLKNYGEEGEAWKSLCTTIFLQGLNLSPELREDLSHSMMSKLLEVKQEARRQRQQQ
ncbi:uncharacterized protein LOC106012312 [Aplysia californica]|uniref:Uncharacterized protein LOC106012312 n=1 Tax=Aplysia californica TaxID=6500 RepID=A0ABM1A3Z1_APLCA|nr:uncharacterized protein LOC106012312 [Aplysia californica]